MLATKALAGRIAVAQPSGAWIGGNRPHDSTRPNECKASSATALPKVNERLATLAEIVFVRIRARLGALLAVLPSARMLRHCAGRYRLPS